MAMDNVNPVEADKLFEGIPWEAWDQVTASYTPVFASDGKIIRAKRRGMTKRFAQYFLTLFGWNEDDGWKPKRK